MDVIVDQEGMSLDSDFSKQLRRRKWPRHRQGDRDSIPVLKPEQTKAASISSSIPADECRLSLMYQARRGADRSGDPPGHMYPFPRSAVGLDVQHRWSRLALRISTARC